MKRSNSTSAENFAIVTYAIAIAVAGFGILSGIEMWFYVALAIAVSVTATDILTWVLNIPSFEQVKAETDALTAQAEANRAANRAEVERLAAAHRELIQKRYAESNELGAQIRACDDPNRIVMEDDDSEDHPLSS